MIEHYLCSSEIATSHCTIYYKPKWLESSFMLRSKYECFSIVRSFLEYEHVQVRAYQAVQIAYAFTLAVKMRGVSNQAIIIERSFAACAAAERSIAT